MDDPQPMRLDERLGDLTGERDRRGQIERTTPQPYRQCLAVDILHGDVAVTVGLAHFVDRADVWMIEPRGGLCLAHEPPAGSVVVGRCGRQQFERHSPVEARVFGEIDVAHASCAQRGLNDIAAEASAGSKWHGALSVAETRRSRARGETPVFTRSRLR